MLNDADFLNDSLLDDEAQSEVSFTSEIDDDPKSSTEDDWVI